MGSRDQLIARRWWLLQLTALLIHVADEAIGDLVSYYNLTIDEINSDLGTTVLPTLILEYWLAAMLIVIAILFSLTRWVSRVSSMARRLVLVVSALMVLNGVGHVIGSIFLGHLLPGFWSSPLLIVVSAVVFRHFVKSPPLVPES